MKFTSRRGRRPAMHTVANTAAHELTGKEITGKKDSGTKELRAKIRLNMTKEPVDICHERKIIGDDEHNAALHFRWLYMVRFGPPDVSALDWNNYYGRELKEDNHRWREIREKEYAEALEKLRGSGALKIVMNIVVFNHFPRFLTGVNFLSRAQIIQNQKEISRLKEGLSALSRHWGMAGDYDNNYDISRGYGVMK